MTTCLPSSPSASCPYQQPSRTPNDTKHRALPASRLPPPPPPPLAPPPPSGGVQMMVVVKEEGAQQILQVPHPQGPSHQCTNGPKLQGSGSVPRLLALPPAWFTPPPRPPHPPPPCLAIRHPSPIQTPLKSPNNNERC
ncbi:unnamed protein product [Cyclocybe aegerita]|uniref:Uncharacterized protein n=1 Tax=Cyclocybe aegerita TaxID=1973307 RepID=A0A8S0VSQ1_CYCAE|nr:unnamed protein product [Cyclocybe aegerita]